MRGSEKKIIYLSDTGSAFFEEAYFILRQGAADLAASPDDMVREAERIVSESADPYPRRKPRLSARTLSFFAGAAAASTVLGALAWLLAWI